MRKEKSLFFPNNNMHNMAKKTIHLIAVLSLLALTATAAPRTKARMQQAAATAINQHRAGKLMAPRTDALKVLKSTASYEIIGYDKGGFAVISADDLVPEVLGVSLSNYSEGRNLNFQWWLNAMDEVVQYAVAHNIPLKTTKPDPNKYPTEVEPMVTTFWDQETPYNNMCPTFSGSTKCLTGCVATAMAQVLNYHKTPPHGQGQRTIYYPYNSYSGQAVTANFEDDYYDWENMRDTYVEGQYTPEEANAVALLMRDCGVAADMQYGGPSEGSGAYSQDAAQGLRDYFGIEDAECLERDNYSESDWMDIVYRELSEHGPVYYAGGDSWAGGHAFVIHGYTPEGKVVVNWGWSGDDDGEYDIALLNPSYYQFKYQQDMIIGITSDNALQLRSEEVTVASMGTLQQEVEALEGEGPIGKLAVNGPLDDNDMLYLRYLAGRDSEGQETEGSLRTLDLTDATLPDNGLSEAIFKDCASLRRVMLPKSIESIGQEAFSGCTSLASLRVPSKQIPTLNGTKVFQGVPFGAAHLYVRSGLKTKYAQAAQWSEFGTQNITEFGTSVKVRNTIRYYGEENPEFLYIVNGDPVHGKPEMTCEATPSSPAGRYPITITPGTISSEDVDFFDGYLVVQRVDATATVGNYTREAGQPNPEFEIESYEGLVLDETEPVWVEEPVITTTADEDSPEGEYPIIVESAKAAGYKFTFIAGTLTVTPATTGITDVTVSTEKQQKVYTIDGRQVKGQPQKGVYIINGKKVVK
jgi:hypothetical protein